MLSNSITWAQGYLPNRQTVQRWVSSSASETRAPGLPQILARALPSNPYPSDSPTYLSFIPAKKGCPNKTRIWNRLLSSSAAAISTSPPPRTLRIAPFQETVLSATITGLRPADLTVSRTILNLSNPATPTTYIAHSIGGSTEGSFDYWDRDTFFSSEELWTLRCPHLGMMADEWKRDSIATPTIFSTLCFADFNGGSGSPEERLAPFNDPVFINLLYIPCPKNPGVGIPYTKEEIRDLFLCTLTVFSKAKAEAGTRNLELHLDSLCRDTLGHNPKVMALIQYAAASIVNANRVIYHASDASAHGIEGAISWFRSTYGIDQVRPTYTLQEVLGDIQCQCAELTYLTV